MECRYRTMDRMARSISHAVRAVGAMNRSGDLLSEIRRWAYSHHERSEPCGTSAQWRLKGEIMANTRPSQRQLAETKHALRREQMEQAVADGRLVIRSMTAREREQSDVRWANARDQRDKRRQHA